MGRKKKLKKFTEIDYKKLVSHVIKEKYFSLILGMTISYVLTSIILTVIFKNIDFKMPKFSFNKKTPTITQTPVKQTTYIVAEGDDLWHIAQKFYNSGYNAFDIAKANKLPENGTIEIGQKLIIPIVTPKQSTVGEVTSIATEQVIIVDNKYVVQPGDSLSIIAGKVYGDIYSYTRLMQLNNLPNPDSLEVGMILKTK